MNTKIKVIGKAALGLAATVTSAYIGLCSYFSYQASQLPDPEQDRLAIMISKPKKWYDYGRYFPGATDLYIHRVETAVGKKAIVYDPVKKGDITQVLYDTSISDMVIAGHGSWDTWNAVGSYELKVTEKERNRPGYTREGKPVERPTFERKEGLFLRHTCGTHRKWAANAHPDDDVVVSYLWKLQDAVSAVLTIDTSKGNFYADERLTRVVVRQEAQLSHDDEAKIDGIMSDYFTNAIAHAEVKLRATEQLGAQIVSKRENVRGWDYVTNPLLFLWDPIPRYKGDQELIAQYEVEIRPQILKEKPYVIVSELENEIAQSTRHNKESIAKIEKRFWQDHWYFARHREAEDFMQECLPYLYVYSTSEFFNEARNQCDQKGREYTLRWFALQDSEKICTFDFGDNMKAEVPQSCRERSMPLGGNEEFLSSQEWVLAETRRVVDEIADTVCLPETSVFRL